jgi:hypothetical protein
MRAKSSINLARKNEEHGTQAGRLSMLKHNDRTQKSSYLIDTRSTNEFDRTAEQAMKLVRDLAEQARANFKARTNQKVQWKEEDLMCSAVLNIKENTTLEDVQNVAKHIEEKYNMRVIQCAIHRDEGYKDKELNETYINHHAHIEFLRLDVERGTTTFKKGQMHIEGWKKSLSELQDDVAEILKMKRGHNYKKEKIGKPKRRTHFEVKRDYEQIDSARREKRAELQKQKKTYNNNKAVLEKQKEEYNKLKKAEQTQIEKIQKNVRLKAKSEKQLAELEANKASNSADIAKLVKRVKTYENRINKAKTELQDTESKLQIVDEQINSIKEKSKSAEQFVSDKAQKRSMLSSERVINADEVEAELKNAHTARERELALANRRVEVAQKERAEMSELLSKRELQVIKELAGAHLLDASVKEDSEEHLELMKSALKKKQSDKIHIIENNSFDTFDKADVSFIASALASSVFKLVGTLCESLSIAVKLTMKSMNKTTQQERTKTRSSSNDMSM